MALNARMTALALNESEDEDGLSEDNGWIPWFCALKGHGILAEIDEEFARDNFNLYGLSRRFTFYDAALEMILAGEAPDDEDLADTEFLGVFHEATELYAVIHSRYIISPRGLQVMKEKFLKGVFGTCPRVLCDRQHVLPIGELEELRTAQLKIYCPKCEQVYVPMNKYKQLDGAFFGMSFPQIFLQSYPAFVPLDAPKPFVPRVFGFKLHKQRSLIARKLEGESGPDSKGGKDTSNGTSTDQAMQAAGGTTQDTPIGK